MLKRILVLIAVLAFAALAFALGSQYLAGMRPCAWCVLQRLIVLLAGVLALAGLAWPRAAAFMAAGVAGLGVSGVLSAWHQYSVAARQFSCAQTLADRFMNASGLESALPWLFGIRASCMDARADLLGVEYALWGLTLFVVLTALALAGLRAATRRPRRP